MAPPILLIDDDLSLAQALMLVLENLGLEVEHCATGEVAIDLLRQKRYAVAVVDVILTAGISGIYVVNAIREMPVEKRPVVLMLTGANIESLRGVDRTLVTAVMLKPVDFELFGQYVLATYRKALGVPAEAAIVQNKPRVRSFCGRCGAEITPWIPQRPLLPQISDDTFAIWAGTPCRSCGVTPREAGGRTEWTAASAP